MEGMALMLSRTCDALRAAGAPDDKAREAAEEIAGFEDHSLTIVGLLRSRSPTVAPELQRPAQ